MPAYAGRPRGYRVGPNPRPSLWVNPHDHLQKWNAGQRERGDVAQDSFPLGCPEEDGCFVHAEAQQRVMPTCWRNFAGLCDEMHRVSATVAHALCRAAYAERSRLVRHPNSALQLAAVYSPFRACWSVLDYDREVRRLKGGEPNFDRKVNQLGVALSYKEPGSVVPGWPSRLLEWWAERQGVRVDCQALPFGGSQVNRHRAVHLAHVDHRTTSDHLALGDRSFDGYLAQADTRDACLGIEHDIANPPDLRAAGCVHVTPLKIV